MLVFEGRGKPKYPEKTSRCRVEAHQTQPTYDPESGNRTRATLVGGKCSHHCALPAPHPVEQTDDKIKWPLLLLVAKAELKLRHTHLHFNFFTHLKSFRIKLTIGKGGDIPLAARNGRRPSPNHFFLSQSLLLLELILRL